METAVCLVSGGMDSCVTAAIAHSQGLQLAFLHVNYGQLTQGRELRAFQDLADHYQVRARLVVDISHLKQIGGSALTDPAVSLPPGALRRREIPASYVPFRNANLLAIAGSWAEVLGASWIFIGAMEEDSSGYPDCRERFFEAFNAALREGTRPETRLEIVAPLLHMRKKEIVLKALQLGAPLELTWSCYREEETACGGCDSCLLRLRAFKEAGMRDPIPYQNTGEAG
jgi:7-cyano-7-deazaguanine synthase